MKMKKKKGFTLIELLIVVAIIAILAAIAIPQFAQYRLKGYNTSANSDLRNCRTSEEALFADWQRYGRSDPTAPAVPPALPASAGGYGAAVNVIAGPALGVITTSDNLATVRELQVPVGNGVTFVANTDAAGSSFTMAAKHLQGDTMYGADSDSTATFRDNKTFAVGTAMTAAGAPNPPNPNKDDFSGVGNWIVM